MVRQHSHLACLRRLASRYMCLGLKPGGGDVTAGLLFKSESSLSTVLPLNQLLLVFRHHWCILPVMALQRWTAVTHTDVHYEHAT